MNHITSDIILKNLITPKLVDQNLSSEIDIDKFGQGFQRGLIASLIKIDSEIKQNQKNSKRVDEKRKIFSPDFTLILFEEPEAFLHFTQEEKMNKNLSILSKENDKQVIVSTHSNFFTSRNIEDLTNIVRLEKEESTIIHQLTKRDLDELLSDNESLSNILGTVPTYSVDSEAIRYFLWLNQDRTSLFFAQKILLVEGPTEKLFFDYLLNENWDDIKPDGLCIIDINGKHNMVRFMNLLNKFGVKHFIIFDRDNDAKTNGVDHKKLNDYILDNAKGKFCLGADTFEKDIENFVGICTGRDKPLNILYKYKNNDIDERKLFDLKLKLKKLFIDEDDFNNSENLITNLIKLYVNLKKLADVSMFDNGEWSYKYNLAREFFESYDFEKTFSINEDFIYRSRKDTYYLDVCKNLVNSHDDGFYPFYELLSSMELQEDDEENKIIEIYNFIENEEF